MIKVSDVHYVYSPDTPFKKEALSGISMEIKRGEISAIIGHTGSGKSTLAQMFNALLSPTSGSVAVDGIASSGKKTELKELRRRVGMVFQYPEHQIFEETVEREISFGPKNLSLPSEEITRRIKEVLPLVGLSEALLTSSPFELSGGQKRRVAIASVLVMSPDVVILDEPSAGLDPRGKREIMQLIRKIHKESGRTVIMISHSMEEVAEVADRIFVLNEGKLFMEGSPAQVYSHAEELMQIGLDVPQVTQVMQRLGYGGIYTLEQALELLGGSHA